MKALLKDENDGTLIAVSVSQIGYDSVKKQLKLVPTHGNCTYLVDSVYSAEMYIRSLYKTGKIDLTGHIAHKDR